MGYHDEDDSFMSYLYSTSKNHKAKLLVHQWFDLIHKDESMQSGGHFL